MQNLVNEIKQFCEIAIEARRDSQKAYDVGYVSNCNAILAIIRNSLHNCAVRKQSICADFLPHLDFDVDFEEVKASKEALDKLAFYGELPKAIRMVWTLDQSRSDPPEIQIDKSVIFDLVDKHIQRENVPSDVSND